MLVGIIGSPSSGKSTFFKALTLANVEIASYPFTTIKPNEGVGYVTKDCPCKSLNVTCNPNNSKCIDGKRLIPVRLLDVAGLVPDAHKGKGLGNQFLDDLRQGNALIHVLDCSGTTNSEGKPEKDFDPEKTIEMVNLEIDQWIFSILSKNLDKLQRTAAAEKVPIERLIAKQLSGLGITEVHASLALRSHQPDSLEFSTELRKLSKPILIAANKIDLEQAQENFQTLEKKHKHIIPCSAESELALKEADRAGLVDYVPGSNNFTIKSDLNEKQTRALETIRGLIKKYDSTGVQKALDKTIFSLLEMIAVYPVASISKLADSKGNVLPDVYLVKKGTTLKELAEKVHKDIAAGFIGGLNLNKQKIGADYKLQDGDVVEILFKK